MINIRGSCFSYNSHSVDEELRKHSGDAAESECKRRQCDCGACTLKRKLSYLRMSAACRKKMTLK